VSIGAPASMGWAVSVRVRVRTRVTKNAHVIDVTPALQALDVPRRDKFVLSSGATGAQQVVPRIYIALWQTGV
jgi:hypothetical protein